MTIQKSVVMMTNTGSLFDVVGEKFRADGYWGNSDGIHTVSATYQNFKGDLYIQGTLSTDPQDGDWFNIDINPKDHAIDYVVFDGESGTRAYTFVGNFVYLRAIVNRSYRVDLTADVNGFSRIEDGQIDRILLAM